LREGKKIIVPKREEHYITWHGLVERVWIFEEAWSSGAITHIEGNPLFLYRRKSNH